MREKEIDDSFDSEEFMYSVVDKLKGLFVIIEAMGSSTQEGEHLDYDPKYGFEVLNDTLDKATKKAIRFQALIAKKDEEIELLQKSQSTNTININIGDK